MCTNARTEMILRGGVRAGIMGYLAGNLYVIGTYCRRSLVPEELQGHRMVL